MKIYGRPFFFLNMFQSNRSIFKILKILTDSPFFRFFQLIREIFFEIQKKTWKKPLPHHCPVPCILEQFDDVQIYSRKNLLKSKMNLWRANSSVLHVVVVHFHIKAIQAPQRLNCLHIKCQWCRRPNSVLIFLLPFATAAAVAVNDMPMEFHMMHKLCTVRAFYMTRTFENKNTQAKLSYTHIYFYFRK